MYKKITILLENYVNKYSCDIVTDVKRILQILIRRK